MSWTNPSSRMVHSPQTRLFSRTKPFTQYLFVHIIIIETLKMKYGRYIEIVVFFFSVIPQAKISAYRFVHGRFTTFYGMNNITINICAFFKGTVTSNLMILTAAKAKKHTNLYHGCPYKVNLTRTTIVIW